MPEKITARTADATEYVILRQHLTAPPSSATTSSSQASRAQEQWDRHGTVQARSAEHAIRLYADKGSITDGVYIAIPKRSWNPCAVKAHTTTTLKIAPA